MLIEKELINNLSTFSPLSYLGLLENVRVRRAGFAYRHDYT